jgi:hypothetical protein
MLARVSLALISIYNLDLQRCSSLTGTCNSLYEFYISISDVYRSEYFGIIPMWIASKGCTSEFILCRFHRDMLIYQIQIITCSYVSFGSPRTRFVVLEVSQWV